MVYLIRLLRKHRQQAQFRLDKTAPEFNRLFRAYIQPNELQLIRLLLYLMARTTLNELRRSFTEEFPDIRWTDSFWSDLENIQTDERLRMPLTISCLARCELSSCADDSDQQAANLHEALRAKAPCLPVTVGSPTLDGELNRVLVAT